MAALAKVAQCGRLHVSDVVSAALIVKRHKSTELNLTNYKRGTGGRSSFSGVIATVFGATSTLGRPLVNKLDVERNPGPPRYQFTKCPEMDFFTRVIKYSVNFHREDGKIGSQVIIPYRNDPYDVRDLRLCGDLGQILFNQFHLKDEESLRKVMQYSNVVINLVGRDHETKHFSYEELHVESARRLARIAKECGVERFIHVSALNAGHESNNFVSGGSRFLATKLAGEAAVREEFPEATIMRPSDMIGQNDKFVMYYSWDFRLTKTWMPVAQTVRFMPLYKGGKDVTKIPVKVSDVAMGIMNAIKDPESAGKTYQCVGPRAYTLYDIVKYIHDCKRTPSIFYHKFFPAIRMKASLCQLVYKTAGVPQPWITHDKLERESISDQLSEDLPTLEDLGVTPENVEDYIQYLLKPWVDAKYYKETLGEFAKPEKPPLAFSTLSS